MQSYTKHVAGLMGVLVGGFVVYTSLNLNLFTSTSHPHVEKAEDEVHVHSDWLVIINDEYVSFVDNKYQSSSSHVLHSHMHLHDGDDLVLHRHEEGITFADFVDSIGFTLTNDCLTTDKGEKLCSTDNEKLLLFVNGERYPEITKYIIEEEDQILLYYGIPNNPRLDEYLGEISDESCLYSGTCLERGYKTTSGCGLTCEI